MTLQVLQDRSDALRAFTATERQRLETQRQIAIFFEKRSAQLENDTQNDHRQWVKIHEIVTLLFNLT